MLFGVQHTLTNLYDLKIELIGCTSSLADLVDAGKFIALYKATTPTGQEGYLAYEYAWRRENVVWEDLRCTDNLQVTVDKDFPPSGLEVFNPKQAATGAPPTRYCVDKNSPVWLDCVKRIFGHERYQSAMFRPALNPKYKAVTKRWGNE